MIEEKALWEALEYCKCHELPDELKDGEIFVKAIVKVLKSNSMEGFCIAVNDGTGKPDIKKSFGSVAQIVQVLSIHPLSVLDRNYVPSFGNIDDVTNFLLRRGENYEYIKSLVDSDKTEDKEKLKALVIRHCIREQMNGEARIVARSDAAKREEEEKKKAEEEKARHEAEIKEKEKKIKERAKNEASKRTKKQKTARKS